MPLPTDSVLVSKAIQYDTLAPPDDSVSVSKVAQYAILDVPTESVSKIVQYTILGVPTESVSKLVQYDILTPPNEAVSKIVQYVVLGPVVPSHPGANPSFNFPLWALPVYRAADFLQAALNLLPRGRAWAKYVGSNLYLALQSLMPTYERSSLQFTNLLIDIFPPSTQQLLPEWEASLGLPDPCAGAAPTVEERRNQVVARFIANGGQSIPYIVAFAANLGFTITITESGQGFLMGLSDMGIDALGSEGQIFIWYVNAPLYSLSLFEMGVNSMGDPLGWFAENSVLECEIRALAPAHTEVVFLYS